MTNNRPPTYPDGQEVEITSFEALEAGWSRVTDQRRLEHLFTFLLENPQRFRVYNLTHQPNLHYERWTLDFPEEYEFLRAVFEALYPTNPAFGMWDVIRYLAAPRVTGDQRHA